MNDGHTPLLLIGTILVMVALVPACGILWTWHNVPWQGSRIGRVLHGKAVAIAEVLTLSLIAAVLSLLELGRPWWFELLRLLAFGHVAVSLWGQWGAYRAIVKAHEPDVEGEEPVNDHT